MAGFAGLAGELLNLPEHVQGLESLRERPLEEHQTALAHLRVDVDARGRERIENALTAVVDDTDTKLPAIEAGSYVRDGNSHLLVAPRVQRADVISRTDLLYCCANSFEPILGIHGGPPKTIILG